MYLLLVWNRVSTCFLPVSVSQKTLCDQHKSLNSFALAYHLLAAFSSLYGVGSWQAWPPFRAGGGAETHPFFISDVQKGAPPWVGLREALPEEIRAELGPQPEDSRITEPLTAALEIQPEPLVWQNSSSAYCLSHSSSVVGLVGSRFLVPG